MKLREKLLVPIGLALLAVLAIHLGALYSASSAWDRISRERVAGHARISQVHSAETAFKTQVQAWKNVLLRGEDEPARLGHFKEFRASEEAFRDHIGTIATDASAPRWARDEALGLLAEHRRVAHVYREALDIFQTAPDRPSHAADLHANGIDRDLAATLARYRQRIEIASDQQVAASQRRGDHSVYGLVIGGAALSLLIIALMLAIVHKLVIRPAQLAAALSRSLLDPSLPHPPELEDRLHDLAEDELGHLLEALCSLHEELQTERGDLEGARKELAASQAAAESAATAKRAFIARITHELRTPLHGLVGCLNLLNDEAMTEDGTTLLGAAEQSAHRLAALVEDILEFTQVSGGDLALEDQSFDVQAMLQGLVHHQQPVAAAAGCTLALAVAPGGPRHVRSDRQRLYNIVEELVQNAISASPEGNVEVILTTASEGRSARVRVDVLDDGPGIPDQLLESIFQPFTQVEDGYDRSKQGAGLGLSRCRRTVEHLGGSLQVSSGDTGTRFWIELTLDRAEHLDVSSGVSSTYSAPITPLPDDVDSERILVVGTGPIAEIRELGFEPHHVHSIDAALRAAAADTFPMVIVEVTRFGIGTLEDLRALFDSAGSLTALVALSRPERRDACLADGWDDFLAREATAGDVAELVERWLDRSALAS